MRTLFFDECTSHKLAAFISELREPADDYEVVHIKNCHTHGITMGMPDLVWMPKVASLAWIVVTVDNHIQRRKTERAERERLKLSVVYLPEVFAEWKKQPQAAFLISAWPNIVEATASVQPGDCFDVAQNKRVRQR